jgi:hypothetical protein
MTIAYERLMKVQHFAGKNFGSILGLFGLIFWLVAVRDARYLDMGGYGLVSILGWTYFAGLVLVVVGFGIELMRTPLRSPNLLVLVLLLVLFLYGTAPAVEPVAELTDSFIHAGFIQYILQHGQALNGYDARFSWPGAFSMAAVLVAFAGKTNALGFLHWFPLFIELSYLAPLLVIARFSGVSRRAGWLGVALYYSANWIFQDYFSPQALNYLFFLVVIAVVLACWQPRRLKGSSPTPGFWSERIWQSRSLLTRSRLLGHDVESTWSNEQLIVILGLLGLIFIASSMSHQLTPYALILALGVCLVTRRLGRPELVVLIVVVAVGWLSLGASNYWVGHLSSIFGSAGQLSSTLSSNVTSRVSGGTSHLFVVAIRILMTGALFLLAGIGFLRRSTNSRALEALAGAPFLLVAAQSYGGEALLRVVLFGLPFTALLAASAILPRYSGQVRSILPRFRTGRFARLERPVLRIVAIVVVLGFAVATTIVRGGNDAYESFSSGELAAVNYVYNHVKPGQSIASANYYLPIGQRDVGTVYQIAPSPPATFKKLGTILLSKKPNFIILAKSEEAYGVQVVGYPADWQSSLASRFEDHGYTVAAKWRTATVLRLTS